VIPEGSHDLLKCTAVAHVAHVAHVATIGPHGEPQNNPVWFDWDEDYFKFSQTKTRQKLRNLGRNPRVALSIVDPENHLRYLEVRGVVNRDEEAPDLDFINAMSEKYLGVYPYQNHRPGDEWVVVFVRPEHTTQKCG
jgi:PPOX class probable F420-dependent enzyme